MGLFWTPHAWFELLEWRMVSSENNLLLRWALLQPSRLLERVRGYKQTLDQKILAVRASHESQVQLPVRKSILRFSLVTSLPGRLV